MPRSASKWRALWDTVPAEPDEQIAESGALGQLCSGTTWQRQGNSGPSNDTGTVRWLSEVLGCAIAVEVIQVGAGVGFVWRTAQVRRHRVSGRAPAPVVVKMPADGATREIGVAQRMDERAVLLDRERARFPGRNRQVGRYRAR